MGYVLTQILGGYLDAWFGGKWVLGLSALGSGLISLIIPAVSKIDPGNAWPVFAARLLEGAFQGHYLRSRVVQGVPSARRLGWVDLKFECSTASLILVRLMGIGQERLGKMVVHPNQSQPNQVQGSRADGTPCTLKSNIILSKVAKSAYFYSVCHLSLGTA